MVRRFLQVVTLVATLVVGATAAAIIVSQTVWFKDWLRGFIVRQANGYLEGQLAIGRLGGNLFSGIELERVTVSADGRPAIEVRELGLDYSVVRLLSGGITLDDIRLDQPVVYLRRTNEGWNLARLVKRQAKEADRTGPGRPIAIGSIGVSDGTLVIDDAAGTTGTLPSRIDKLDVKAGFAYSPVRYTVDIEHVSFDASEPALALRSLSGRISTEGDALHFERVAVRTAESALSIDGAVTSYTTRPVLELHARSDKVALAEIARLVPALAGLAIQPAFDLKASGPLDRLHLVATTRSSAGRLDADVTADLVAPRRRVAGTVDLAHLDIRPLVRGGATKSDITGKAQVDLRIVEGQSGRPLAFLEGTYRVDAPRVAIAGYDARDVRASGRIADGVVHLDGRAVAYGAIATVRGEVDPATPLRLDLEGRARGLDLRRLPANLRAPALATDIAAAYDVSGTLGTSGRLDVKATLEPSTIAGARFDRGTTAHVTLDRGTLAYESEGRVEGLDVQRIGEGLRSETLSADRYRSSLTGSFSVRGAGTSLLALTLDARADLERSALFGGTLPSMRVTAAIVDGGLSATANGSFGGVDPATIAGQPAMAGRVSGTADVSVSLPQLGAPLSPTAVGAAGRVTLADSEVAGVTISTAEIDGRFEHGAGDLRTLRVAAPEGTLASSGHVDLTGESATNLTYEVEVPALEPIGSRVGQALSGSATAKGRVTGTGPDLATEGTLTLGNLRAPSASALSATSHYQARLPGMDPSRIEVDADTTASLVEAAGMKLTELRARTTWGAQRLGLDATLRDQQRTLDVAGDVVLHTDHQEVHLRNLAFRTNGVEWRTEPGRESAIQYANGRVAVDRLALVSGPSRIDAEGAFGQVGDQLRVKLVAVDLASIDRLALGTGTLAGTLDGSALVGGPREAMKADATFAIANGGFRGFKYASFGGTIGYDATGARVDVRLDQSPGAWLTAKGVVPAAALRSEATPAAPGAHEPTAAGEGMDLVVTSSALDLSIVEGFVPQVTKASGTVQADVRVLGTVHDPHLDGHVDVRNGAFTIEQLTKGGYTGLDTRIAFEPDRVRIGELRILDEHQRPLRIAGELGVHARQVGQVRIAVQSEGFEVIDNELAEVTLTSDLQVTGELSAPRVAGSVAVHTGTVDVDRVLETFTTGAYAEAPAALPGTEAAPAGEPTPAAAPPAPPASAETTGAVAPAGEAATTPPRPTGFDAVTLDVALRVPDNLVVKGNDLNPSGTSPVSLGSVNVTLGGDLRVSKQPGTPVRVVGTVNTVRGTYDFQGRRFEIARDGRIQFTGGARIDPRLDLTATRVISGVRAQVHVRGSVRRPQLALSSQPPLDEADILSLIVFNQPANQLGEGEQTSLATRAGALASGFVASTLAQSIGQALDLDVFEVQATPEDGAGPSVTVGEQVGERLFFKFRQAFGAQSVSELILEYQLAPYLRLQTSVAEGATERTLVQRVEQGGIDLIFYYAY